MTIAAPAPASASTSADRPAPAASVGDPAGLRAALSDVDRLGWDSAPGDAILRYARTEVVRVAVRRARLRGPAADDAASTGWAAAWKILNKPGLRHEPSPWGLVAAAVRREVVRDQLAAAYRTNSHAAWRLARLHRAAADAAPGPGAELTGIPDLGADAEWLRGLTVPVASCPLSLDRLIEHGLEPARPQSGESGRRARAQARPGRRRPDGCRLAAHGRRQRRRVDRERRRHRGRVTRPAHRRAARLAGARQAHRPAGLADPAPGLPAARLPRRARAAGPDGPRRRPGPARPGHPASCPVHRAPVAALPICHRRRLRHRPSASRSGRRLTKGASHRRRPAQTVPPAHLTPTSSAAPAASSRRSRTPWSPDIPKAGATGKLPGAAPRTTPDGQPGCSPTAATVAIPSAHRDRPPERSPILSTDRVPAGPSRPDSALQRRPGRPRRQGGHDAAHDQPQPESERRVPPRWR